MAIRSGQLLFTGDTLLIDRLQTANINPNIPLIPIYEIGSQQKLTTLRDIPNLSFDAESYDVSTKFEAIICGLDPTATSPGQQFDFNNQQALTVASPFRSAINNYQIINGAIVPHMGLEQVQYRFGVGQEAGQTYTFRGDSIFYTPNVPYEDKFTATGTATTWTLSHTADVYNNNTLGETQHVVNVSVYNPDGTFYRLFNGAAFDYTDTATTFTLNAGVTPPVSGAIIRAQYSSTAAETIAASANAADGLTVKPAAIRAKDIDIFMGNGAATPVFTRWTGVQSFDMTWRVNLDANEEFGNPQVVSQDYVTADVTGTITTRDNTVTDLFKKLYQAANVTTGQVIGALSSTAIPMEIHLNDPQTGTRLKTIYVPDARFDPPQMNARANQKLDTPFKFTSDSGLMFVYNGQRPGGSSQP